MSAFQRTVHELVRSIPRGMVSTYGEVARAAGSAGGARAVGAAMQNNPYAPGCGCAVALEVP